MIATQHTGTLASILCFGGATVRTPNTARRVNGLGEDPNSGAFQMPSGKNSTSLFCILSNQHLDQRFSQLLLVLYFFFLPLSFGSRSPLILNSLCKNTKKDNPLDLIDTKPWAPPPHMPLSSAYGPYFF